MNKKRVLYLIISIIILGCIISFMCLGLLKIKQTNNIENLKDKKLVTIKSHYSNNVIVKNDTKLYKLENNKYIEYGEIAKNQLLNLEDINITDNTKYFLIKNFNLYISYLDVLPYKDIIVNQNSYKNYIFFNKNIITQDTTNFYNDENKLIYKINESFEFPILVMDSDRYGIIYNDKLLYIKKDNIKTINDNDNGYSNKAKIRTLTYHFLYDSNKTTCNEVICQSLEMFETHLKYIRENNYFTLTMKELELYLDGKINIPSNSIVITIDDATLFDEGAIKLLEKYQVNATLFVITSINSNFDYLKSDYLDLESHTDNMHNQYECSGYGSQGGGILCLPEERVLADLKLSQEKLGGSKYFSYPFFDFNDRAIELLKKSGFNMAFIGQFNTEGYSYPNKTNKYKVPRMTIFSTDTMDEFISYLN